MKNSINIRKRLHQVLQRLRKLRRRTKVLLLLLLGLFTWFWFCLPRQLFHEPTSFVIEDAQGNLLGATVADDGQWRFPGQKEVPEKFKQCIIAYEDKRFYRHWGVDPLAMVRAIRQNIRHRGVVSGGSTITMQVIRLSRNKNRNLFQKLVEMIMAVRLEIRCSKKEILSLYAAHAPFGSNVVGLDAAAWRYYGRSPDQLSWGEMAALAVLPNSPALVHPGRNRDVLLRKRNEVLWRLKEKGILDEMAYQLALAEPLPGDPHPLPQLAPHLLQRFRSDYRREDRHTPTRLRTTIDGELQQQVMQIVEQHHTPLRDNGIQNLAALVVEVESGRVLSYVGNIYHPEQADLESHVDVVTAPRSPGSLLKPLLLAASLHDGMVLPQALVPDIPTQIGGYMPENFDRQYAGAVPASLAVARSLNIPAVRMLRQYKYNRFYDWLRQAGVTTLHQPADHYGLSLILGGSEVTLWEMAGIYASLARAYQHQRLYNGRLVHADLHMPVYREQELSAHPNDTAVSSLPMDMTSLWFMFQAMGEVMRPGEEGLWQQFSSSRRIAWKTGTSFGFRDGWAIGVTPGHVVAVWVGNTDGEGRAGLIGVRTAAPVMFDIFRLLPASGWFDPPAYDYAFIPVCRQSGFKAGPYCTDTVNQLVPAAGYRSPVCPYHQLVHLDPTGQFQVNASCESPDRMLHTGWFVLPPGMEHYYRQYHADYKPLPPYREGCGNTSPEESMDLYYPQPGARIYIPVEISGQRGSTVFTAAHRDPDMQIYWHLDQQFLGATRYKHQMAVSPPAGKHILTLVDEQGSRITRSFEVLEK